MEHTEALVQARLAGGLAAQQARSTGSHSDLNSVWSREVDHPLWRPILDALEAADARFAFALGYRDVMGSVTLTG